MNIQKMGHSLAQAARWQERYINRHLESFGLSSRTLPFYLAVEDQEGISQKKLMEQVVADKTRTTKAINHLVKLDYVERRTDKNDKRIKGVVLTQQGRRTFPAVEKVLKRLDRILADQLSTDEMKKFIDMLDRFSTAVHQEFNKDE